MMNNFRYILCCILFLVFFISCDNPERIFKGEIIVVNNPGTDRITSTKLDFDGLYTGYFSVYDSLIFFFSHKYGDYHCATFDINTGKYVGNFFRKGQGPGDFIDFYLMHFESGYNAWINEFNKRHYILIDMATEEEKKRIDASGIKKKGHSPFIQAFILNDSLLIAINQPEMKNMDCDIFTPSFKIINYLTKNEIISYELYDEELYNKLQGRGIDNEHLCGICCIKPDKNKIANIMDHLYQINILDIKTGELKGYRIKGTTGFNFVRNPMPPGSMTQNSYSTPAADDIFIYSMLQNRFDPDSKPVFHVFDWNGNFVRILETDQKGSNFAFDEVRKKIYTKDDEENVWVYDVSYLYE